ncbi:MAG: hypothetical protein AB7S41_15445 [Parvibaculaceae bacterium]
MPSIKFGKRELALPASRVARICIGVGLVVLGIFGFLPILGFWMIPVGLIILSVDIPAVRRWRRQATVRLGLWLKERYPGLASKIGFDHVNHRPR